MKLLVIISIFFIYFITSYTPIKGINTMANNCQSILDSANIFAQTSEFAVNMKPSIQDSERNARINKWLQQLSFKQLSCLLKSTSLSLKAVGEIYAERTYSDSLLKNYPYLINDTTAIQLITADGNNVYKLTMGEFLLPMVIQRIKEDKDTLSLEPGIEYIISSFVKQYSTYPNSYKPISFSNFFVNMVDYNLNNINIRHTYMIVNNKGETLTVRSGFNIDNELNVNVIEKDSTSYIYSSPPMLKQWLIEFGKNLNKNDSLKLKLW